MEKLKNQLFKETCQLYKNINQNNLFIRENSFLNLCQKWSKSCKMKKVTKYLNATERKQVIYCTKLEVFKYRNIIETLQQSL